MMIVCHIQPFSSFGREAMKSGKQKKIQRGQMIELAFQKR
jgi:hypothetical protein